MMLVKLDVGIYINEIVTIQHKHNQNIPILSEYDLEKHTVTC